MGRVVGCEVFTAGLLEASGRLHLPAKWKQSWRSGERGDHPFASIPAPEGLSQACAINFQTIYSQVEFIFPEQPHMWCVSGFRFRGGWRRSWSQHIKVATNSVFLVGFPLERHAFCLQWRFLFIESLIPKEVIGCFKNTD